MLVALAVLLAAGFGRSLVSAGSGALEWTSVRLFGCDQPTELAVLTTPEGLTTARRLVDAYTMDSARRHQGCPTVGAHVYAAPADQAREALRGGWQGSALRSIGPRPAVWLPGSSRYALGDPAVSSNGLLVAAPRVSLAATPLVLAVPSRTLPENAQRTGLTWTDLLDGLPALGLAPGVARPDPLRSVTGEFATVAMYASAGGDPSRLAEPAVDPGLAPASRIREIESGVATALDTGGYPIGDALDLLCRQRGLDRPAAALALTEQQVVQYNSGEPLGDRCPGAGEPPPERTLTALYPSDTLHLDQPLIELRWKDQSARQAAQVTELRSWLTAEPGKRALTSAGLRPPNWPVSGPLSERFGARSDVVFPPVQPTDRVLSDARTNWQAAQRPGRVLLLLDGSGSMREPVGPAGPTRFDVATRGVGRLSDRMGARDEFGLWVFHGPGRTPQRLLPFAAGGVTADGTPRRDAVAAALRTVRPAGDTPLYRAIVDGVGALGPAGPDRVRAVVVLTDGVDEGSDVTAEQLVAAGRAAAARVFVVSVGEARCSAPPIRQVTGSTGGACYETDFTSLASRLDALVDTLWSGGGGNGEAAGPDSGGCGGAAAPGPYRIRRGPGGRRGRGDPGRRGAAGAAARPRRAGTGHPGDPQRHRRRVRRSAPGADRPVERARRPTPGGDRPGDRRHRRRTGRDAGPGPGRRR
ncbi:substrate-binding and VWA domain-containing protein [Micromonospora zhanjiangensis]